MKLFKEKMLTIIIPLLQIAIIIAASILTKEIWYRIIIACTGILFNYFVCAGKRIGFIIGSIYAICYGTMAFFDKIYASAFFMIIIQLPMALISFINWKKNSNNNLQLKRLSAKQLILGGVVTVVSYFAILGILLLLKSSGAGFDAFFLSATLISCILLARYYKEAYIFIMLSGLAGTSLWLYQYIAEGKGLSILILNSFVLFNAIIAIIKNYKKSKSEKVEIE